MPLLIPWTGSGAEWDVYRVVEAGSNPRILMEVAFGEDDLMESLLCNRDQASYLCLGSGS